MAYLRVAPLALVISCAVPAACGGGGFDEGGANSPGGIGGGGRGGGGEPRGPPPPPPPPPGGGGGGGTGPGGGGGGGVGLFPPPAPGGPDALPPEEELESSYGAPVATGRYVWIPNPSSGRVAYVDAATLAVATVEAGNAPTFLAPVPDEDEDVAIVLNVLSRDATLLRAKDGALSSETLSVPSGGNAWAVSSEGRWALAWSDARRETDPDPVDGFQDVTVLDLTPGAETSTALTVGYRPVAVAFDASSSRAFAVTQDGITVITLAGGAPAVVKNVKLSDDAASDALTRDVSITPDGSYALVRRDGVPTVSVFSLDEGTRTDVALPAPATDLDLAPDGSLAVVVIRETGQVALLPIPGVVDAPADFPLIDASGGLIGSASLAAASPVAFLYTNAVPSDVLTVLDTSGSPPEAREILLRAPIEAVFPTADAAHALVLHDTPPDDGTGQPSEYVAAMSVAPIALDLPAKILGLRAPPVSVAVAPAGHRAIVATGDAQSSAYQLFVARMPSLQIDAYTLPSKPIAAGIVAGADRGFVAQEHPDGRITFVDFATGEAKTITGFELASQVVDGSEP